MIFEQKCDAHYAKWVLVNNLYNQSVKKVSKSGARLVSKLKKIGK